MIDKILLKYKSFLQNTFKNEFISTKQKIKEEILISNFNNLALTSSHNGVTDQKYSDNEIIVSLTSYSKRVYNVHLVIESLFNQTLKPNRIILWLNEPYTIHNIPLILKKQMERGLEIRFVEDLKSYDKLIHSLKEFPDDTIITCDDDIIYPFDFIERLVINHIIEPSTIFFYRGHKMVFNEKGKLVTYKNWIIDGATSEDSKRNFPNGGAGTLYPPHSLSSEVMNVEKMLSLAPNADDIWFRAMTLLQKTPCKKVELEVHPFEKMISISASQNIALWKKNVELMENDLQINRVFSEYGIFYLILDK